MLGEISLGWVVGDHGINEWILVDPTPLDRVGLEGQERDHIDILLQTVLAVLPPSPPFPNERYMPGILRRVKDYPSQKSAGDWDARRENVRGAFSAPAVPSGAEVVLVDDIITSGSTLLECATTLLGAGASHVTVLALGITQTKVVLRRPTDVLHCPGPKCPGEIVCKPTKAGRLFWGCTEFWDRDCKESCDFEKGISFLNKRNIREKIEVPPDVPF